MAFNSDEADTLKGRRKERIKYLTEIGVEDPEWMESELASLVRECLLDLCAAAENLPAIREATNKSHNNNANKAPSQNFGDLAKELEEFHRWFSGGRKPRGRDRLSSHAIKLLLGEKPFGSKFLVLERGPIPRRVDGLREVDWALVESIELWSEQDDIALSQLQGFATARGENGESLWGYVMRMPDRWPEAFLRLVARHRSQGGAPDIPFERLADGLTDEDRKQMADGLSHSINLLAVWRRNPDRRQVMTIARWAGSEPVYKLMRCMLNLVWPVERGATLPSTAIGALAGTLILDLQSIVDNHRHNSNLLQHFGTPRSVLGGVRSETLDRDVNVGERLDEIVSFIRRRRQGHVAYFWATHTSRAILAAVQAMNIELGNAELRQACSVTSGVIIGALDVQLNRHRNLLGFGSDRPQGELFKWFGDGGEKSPGNVERAIAKLALAGNCDKAAFLEQLTLLVTELKLGAQADSSWRQIAAWASGAGRDRWEVTPQHPEGYVYSARQAGLAGDDMFAADFR